MQKKLQTEADTLRQIHKGKEISVVFFLLNSHLIFFLIFNRLFCLYRITFIRINLHLQSTIKS